MSAAVSYIRAALEITGVITLLLILATVVV